MHRISFSKKAVFRTCASALGLATAGLSGIASAQDVGEDADDNAVEQRGLSTIVVTAQLREESSQDIPISVLVTSGDELRDAGISRLEGLTQELPNVTITEGGLGDNLYVRGIGSGLNTGFEQSVGTFIDGIYYGRGLQTRSSFLDIERVEALRGPQSIFFGQNTIAGALNIATVEPSLNYWEGYAQGGYEFGTRRASIEAAAGGPLSDNVALRLAATYVDQGGWQINRSLGEHEPREERYAGRATLLIAPSDTFEIVARVQFENSDVEGRALQAVGCPPPDGQVPAGYCLAYGIIGNGQTPDFEFDNGRNGGNGVGPLPAQRDDFNFLDTFSTNLTMNWEVLDGHTITSLTGWSEYDDYRAQTGNLLAGPFPTPALPFHNTELVREHYDQFSQEIRLTSPSGGTLEYIAGFYYQTSNLNVINDFSATLFATRLSDHRQDEETLSGFASLTWNATDTFRLTGGLRYSSVDKSIVREQILASNTGNLDLSQAIPMVATNPLFGLFTGVFGWQSGTIAGARTDDAWLPSINIEYDVADDIMLYAGFSEGFKAGGFDEQNGRLDPASISFEPETADSFEIGLKSNLFNNDVRFNIAAFYTTFTNLQSITFDGTLNFLVTNSAKSRSRGIEADLAWQITDNLRFDVQAAYLDAYYVDRQDGQCTTSQIATLRGQQIATPAPGCNSVNGILVQDLSGTRLPYSPEFSGNANLSYDWDIGDWSLTTSFGAYWETDYTFAEDADPFLAQDGYVKLNGSLRLRSPNEQFEFAVIAENLNDVRTSHSGNDLPLSAGSYILFLDRPLTVNLQARVTF